jgi:Rrf2 family protein
MKLTPTNRTDYAVRALIYLANHPGSHAKAADIGAAMDIPTGFLHQVLQELQRARLVSSRSGPSGGYLLARKPEDITILEIVETMEGPIEASECALRGGPCHWDDVCALHWVWSSARAALADSLRGATLARVAADDRGLQEGALPVPADSHRRR